MVKILDFEDDCSQVDWADAVGEGISSGLNALINKNLCNTCSVADKFPLCLTSEVKLDCYDNVIGCQFYKKK